MIYSLQPNNWQDLQNRVAAILKAIGLQVEIGKTIETPRGRVEIDVWAQDSSRIPTVTYVIECKNWNKNIPQNVIHGFMTVMHETGANVGFLISKKGVQSGAKEYLQKTNITAVTYDEFESMYLNSWWGVFMNIDSASYADRLIQYTEPINSFRQRKLDLLSKDSILQYNLLCKKYYPIAYFFSYLEVPTNFNDFKKRLLEITTGELDISSNCYADSLAEIGSYLEKVTGEFDLIFGERLFV